LTPAEWQKPGGCKPTGVRSTASQAVGALAKLGWVSLDAAEWPRRLKAVTATGGNDDEDVRHHPPIFPYELARFLRGWRRCEASTFVRCIVAAAVVACLASVRSSQTVGLWVVASDAAAVASVRSCIWRSAADAVGIRHADFSKDKRRRMTERPRLSGRTRFYRHWMVAEALGPWVDERLARSGGQQVVAFPAAAALGAGSANDGALSHAARLAGLDIILGDRAGRTWHGWREGTGRELPLLARSRVTRRRLQLRSVKDLLASEDSYVQAFQEELEQVVSMLASHTIEVAGDDLLRVTGRSASAGRLDDAVPSSETVRMSAPIW
jgi:hypothetical protein